MSVELNSPRILCQQCMSREGAGVYVSAHDLATLRTQLAAMTAERDAARAKVTVLRDDLLLLNASLSPWATNRELPGVWMLAEWEKSVRDILDKTK